jgi:hypothetical protein
VQRAGRRRESIDADTLVVHPCRKRKGKLVVGLFPPVERVQQSSTALHLREVDQVSLRASWSMAGKGVMICERECGIKMSRGCKVVGVDRWVGRKPREKVTTLES